MFHLMTMFAFYLELIICVVCVKVSEYENFKPPIFHLDDFDKCFSDFGENALYCTFTLELLPFKNDISNVWIHIQNVSSNPKNYRHNLLRHGLCLPKTCELGETNFTVNETIFKNSEDQIKATISTCYNQKLFSAKLIGNVQEIHCETKEPFHEIDALDIIVGLWLTSLLVLVAIASIYEGIARYYKAEVKYDHLFETPVAKIIQCFALQKNWLRLTRTDVKQENKYLTGIQGVRFFNIMGIILGHTTLVCLSNPLSNVTYFENFTSKTINMMLINSGFVVQTFFVISSMLLSYHFFMIMEKRKRVDFNYICMVFINRYIRLTPCLLVVASFCSTWIYHLSRGPLWDRNVGMEYSNCRDNWWANILYINTFYNPERMCLQQSWYLATDMQLFVVALCILATVWKFPKRTEHILGFFTCIAISIPGILTYANNYDMVVQSYPEVVQNSYLQTPEWHKSYTASYSNAGAYMIGLTYGYMFYKYRGKKEFEQSKVFAIFWWVVVWSGLLGPVYYGGIAYQDGYVNNKLRSTLYATLGRNMFAFSAGLFIFGNAMGVGWFSRTMMQWKPFQILGRLTYCVYLVHVPLLRIRFGMLRYPTYAQDYLLILQTFGDIFMSYVTALVLCLFVEMPVSALQKLILQKGQSPHSRKTSQSCEVDDEQFVLQESTKNSVI